MVAVLPSPWVDQFEALIGTTQSSLIICSPYIGQGPCERLVHRLTRSGRSSPAVHFLTDLSTDNLLSGTTDATALLAVVESLSNVTVRYLPRLHAKVYVRDDAEAIITSGNMTDGGLSRNHELGVRLVDPSLVTQIRVHVTRLSELGADVSAENLRAVSEAAVDLRQRWRAAKASAQKEVKEAFEQRVGEVNDALLGLRVTGRTFHAIVSETILFLLRNASMTTPEIHREIQRLHPDLCDDTIDRVINGERFGKKWKHAVRMAQSHLKKRGRIVLAHGRWSLVS